MSSTGSWRTSSSRRWDVWAAAASAAVASIFVTGCSQLRQDAEGLLEERHWVVEAEQPAEVTFRDGRLDIDAPAGITLWLRRELNAPLVIEFAATAIAEGGPHDHVSDLNVFWMATNRDGSAPYSTPRSGRFEEYHDLLTYYVGLGGNRNTTSRFRRYIGDARHRPLLPEHDLATPDVLLVPNQKQTITLVVDRNTIEYWRDGRSLFRIEDAFPYRRGWFALRTTRSHLRIESLSIRAP
jgi:hypothetical protein